MSRSVLPLAVTAALLAGCGGSSSPSPGAQAPSPGTSSPTAASSGQTLGPGGSAPAGTSGAPAPGAAGASTPASAAATSGQVTNNGGATGVSFTKPGTYTYDTSGTVTAGSSRDASGTATLTVDPPSGGQQHTLLGTDQGRTEQDLVVRRDGTYLARLVITNPAFSKEFRPAQPVLLLPSPTTDGRTWSWQTISTDGKTTASVTAKIAGRETLTVEGARTATTIVESTLRLTGDITYTAQLKTWYDEAHRLTAKEHTKGNGTFGGLQFTTDVTNVLRSTAPE